MFCNRPFFHAKNADPYPCMPRLPSHFYDANDTKYKHIYKHRFKHIYKCSCSGIHNRSCSCNSKYTFIGGMLRHAPSPAGSDHSAAAPPIGCGRAGRRQTGGRKKTETVILPSP